MPLADKAGMTRFVFKSLIVAGAFLYFGGHMPLSENGGALALPQVSCEADFASCRVGGHEIALGERSPLLAEIAAKGRGTPVEDLKRGLADPELTGLLDRQVIPEFAIAAVQAQIAEAAGHFITTQINQGFDTGAVMAHWGE